MTNQHDSQAGSHPHKHDAVVMLRWLLPGAALLLNAYIARWVYPQNPLAAHVAAGLGALLMAIPILTEAVRDILRGEMRMNELIAMALLAALALGDYYSAGLVAFFTGLAIIIETRSAEGAHHAIEKLIRMAPTTAFRIVQDREEEVMVNVLVPGDLIRLRPGEMVPVDGVIRSGRTTLNEAAITGESLPRDKAGGDLVFAGTQNLTGATTIEVTRVGQDTTLGQVRELILSAEQTRLPMLRMIDRYAIYYTPTILMIAAIVLFFTNDWSRIIALLVMSCPCALILATPTAMVAALAVSARMGVLIKHVSDLEASGRLDVFVFDKTGTLTTGELGVTSVMPQEGIADEELLTLASAAESASRHPAAEAIIRYAAEKGMKAPDIGDAHEEPGLGVRAVVNKSVIRTGRISWLRSQGVKVPETAFPGEGQNGHEVSIIGVAQDDRYLGWIGLSDQIRDQAASCIASLRETGVRHIAMVTGDHAGVAAKVAREVGCDDYVAGCLPEDKVAYVQELRSRGLRVAFVGDGVNDAPALTASDTGIAMGAAGSDAAIHSATMALMNNDLDRIAFILQLSHRARRIVLQNIFFGTLLIIVGIALSGFGILQPIMAAMLHLGGTVFIVFNSARLIRSSRQDPERLLQRTENRDAPVHDNISA